jgi:hypothetical protein
VASGIGYNASGRKPILRFASDVGDAPNLDGETEIAISGRSARSVVASCTQGIEWIVYPNRSNPHTKLSKSRSDEVFLGKTQIQVVKDIERFHAEDQAEPFINGEVALAFAIRDSLGGYAETSWLDGTRKTPLMLDRFRTQI